MYSVEVDRYSFQYPESNDYALKNVSFSVRAGDMVLVFGESGSGKSTLLSSLKKEIAPKGNACGRIAVCGKDLTEKHSFAEIGFVSQSPDNQIVCDSVERELAFGLENLGRSESFIRRRIAEIACYFGIEDLLDKKTSELSGGQKQLCNLAAVLCPEPSVLILDEPVAQLDPISAEKFLQELRRVNAEFGITVLLSEHFTENILPYCTKVICLDHGEKIFDGSNSDFVSFVLNEMPRFTRAMPASAILAHLAGVREALPLTVRDGKSSKIFDSCRFTVKPVTEKPTSDTLLTARNLRFAYTRTGEPVLRGVDFDVFAGEIHGIVGGNGAGKSTLMSLLAGCFRPAKGKIKMKDGVRSVLMPQDPKLLFCKETLSEELSELAEHFHYGKSDVLHMMSFMGLDALAHRHPYDLSGGEMQKAALCKLLLTKPDIMFLDEPVKGLDICAKEEISRILTEFAGEGHAVVLITHDLNFAACTVDRMTMISRGKNVCSEKTELFLKNNRFFTTPCVRLTRRLSSCVLTPEEVLGID